jgi:hypothetical protein
MSLLNQETENSRGGICTEFVEVANANINMLFPDVIENEIKAPIDLFLASWQNFYFIRDTFRFSEKPIQRGSDEIYQQKITMIASRDSSARIQKLLFSSRNAWIFRFTDRNGNQKIVGSPLKGAMLSFGRNNKAEFQQRNEMLIEITCESKFPAPVYNPAS